MGIIRQPHKVKLFAGVIAVSETLAAEMLKELETRYGPIDIKSPAIPFTFTDYYEGEMGRGLIRQWAGFKTPIDPSALARIKVDTNALEESRALSGKRSINIDPGYITPAKIVLASSKDFSHRIYLSDGIYAEVTMMYRHKEFVTLEWTYPDYKSEAGLNFFSELRKTCLGL